MLVVRPAKPDDLEAIIHLADLAGPGFTSLAVGADVLERRLNKSTKSFSGQSAISPDHVYLLLLEDISKNEVIGLSAVKAQIGIRDPFFSFRTLKIAQKSAVTGSRFDMEVLVLVNEFAGATEVGSLFVKDGYRGSGAGRLIAQSRYMLMAVDPDRFGDTIVSELRGRVSEAGMSPFWDAIGRKFFRMNFDEADRISAERDNQFILDLMPKYPIYIALLPKAAQEAIGQTHSAGIGARKLLEEEGFRYDGVIDIFDGGPSVSAPRADLQTVKASGLFSVKTGNVTKGETALLCNNDVENFRCLKTEAVFDGSTVTIAKSALDQLLVDEGDSIRIWKK